MVDINLCPPAIIYLIFSIIQIIIDTFSGLYNTATIKILVMVCITTLLQILCQQGLGVVSWVIVFIPFILMTVLVTIILYVFGLDVATGKIHKDDKDSDKDSDKDKDKEKKDDNKETHKQKKDHDNNNNHNNDTHDNKHDDNKTNNTKTDNTNTNNTSTNNTSTNNNMNINIDQYGNILFYFPSYNSKTNPVYYKYPYVIIPNPINNIQ
jgi:predicted membrane protein